MNFLYKLERKFGKYTIKNLPLVLTVLFVFNYLLSVAAPDIYEQLTLSPIMIFYRHQYWRLITWIFTTPGPISVWTPISLVCLYGLGVSAERGMGRFMFNLYIVGGMILNLITVLVVSGLICMKSNLGDYFANLSGSVSQNAVNELYLVSELAEGGYGMTYSVFNALNEVISGGYFINYLVSTCTLFAFAMSYSEGTIFYMFLFPLKAKYVALISFLLLLYDYFAVPLIVFRALVFVTVVYFFLFNWIFRKYSSRRSGRYSFVNYGKSDKKKKSSPFKVRDNKDNVYNMSDYVGRKQGGGEKQMPEGITRHKCAVCGRTENDGEDLVFRFCTKCNGNYEYCNEHIYTHEHVK